MSDLTSVESHFRFGQNWAQFSSGVDRLAIEQSRRELERLLGRNNITGLTFLDVGSGSGIHSLAALEMGASRVVAIDIDPDSVATTRNMLERFAPHSTWSAEVRSIFDATPSNLGQFDIVYSWGVLHHTGAMNKALISAADLVADRGDLCVAIYGKTVLCDLWRAEKRLYAKAPEFVRKAIRGLFLVWFVFLATLRDLTRGRIFRLRDHVIKYSRSRGMQFYTDIHDWLGGYPYESATPKEVRGLMKNLHFSEKRSFVQPGLRHGLLGSGCDEYVFHKSPQSDLGHHVESPDSERAVPQSANAGRKPTVEG